ncbi:MAG: cupin domain-containing protein [Thermoplasmatota archaeon]
MSLDVKTLKNEWAESINNALSLYDIDENIQVGILTIEPETRLPEEGYSVHKGSHEFAYVIEGEVVISTEDEEKTVIEGELTYNSPGTRHYTSNNTKKEAKLLWFVAPPL